ncbi:hypothetical protein A0J61_11943 [Choanephora cucurbitarum]|uniref:Uncharacterized protein n=1 Tax=Choanephora cucurbitarum TaxID=101091 RepID=A0A1C7LM34_9FUNG|nr:hypothetical protein A0J61_11943 [Choanephora cucurbitarum]
MPRLLGAIEQPVGAHGGAYRNVKLFFAHLERYALSQGVNLDFEHRKCMPSIVGQRFRLQMRCASDQGRMTNWETVKQWLSEYVDTLQERAMSVKALFRVKDENNRQFAERWLEALSLVDSERLSVDELTKIYNAISSSNENVMGKKIHGIVIWFHELELPSANKRSAEDAPAERATKKNSGQTEVPKGTEVSRWAQYVQKNARGNKECNRCGRAYTPGHNQTCPRQGHRRNEGETGTPLVNRMANMRVATRPSFSQNIDPADEAADILTEDMEDCQFDRIECQTHYGSD